MPWYNGDYPPSYKNQPPKLRAKAVEIANEIIKESGDEGIAIRHRPEKGPRLWFRNNYWQACHW